ncbi:MAG: hypothetical protein M3277_04125 [Actinomycetota bacterium]|nr:hypothetical protein [Actinomycetota bacterium]
MKRTVGFITALMLLAKLPLPVEATTASDRVVLDLTHPSSSGVIRAADAPVAIYLMPFDAPDSFTPEQVARGTANSDGRFSFSLTENAAAMAEARKTAGREVNILIRTINEERTWMGDVELAVPVDGRRLTLQMDMPMDPADTEGVDDDDLLQSGEVIADTPPPGFSCSDINTSEPPPPTPGPASGAPPWNPYAACEEEAMEEGASSGYVTKYVKFMNLHLSKAMSGSVLWQEGRGSKYQVAYRFCWPLSGGCSTFSAGAMRMEEKSRSTGAEINRTGVDHQTWRFEYTGQRRRRCVEYETRDPAHFGRCKKVKRYWIPYNWTWGTDKNPIRRRQPRMRDAYSVELAPGVTIRTTEHVNRVFGKGVSLFGVSLDSQANYSEISALSWTARKGCKRHFIYGADRLPRYAPEIFARSRGCD